MGDAAPAGCDVIRAEKRSGTSTQGRERRIAQEPRGAAARELGSRFLAGRCHPQPRTRLLLSQLQQVARVNLARLGQNAKRLALNSRYGMLIGRMIYGASLRIARGVRAVRDARRARSGSRLERRARPCRPFPSRHSPWAGAGGRTRPLLILNQRVLPLAA